MSKVNFSEAYSLSENRTISIEKYNDESHRNNIICNFCYMNSHIVRVHIVNFKNFRANPSNKHLVCCPNKSITISTKTIPSNTKDLKKITQAFNNTVRALFRKKCKTRIESLIDNDHNHNHNSIRENKTDNSEVKTTTTYRIKHTYKIDNYFKCKKEDGIYLVYGTAEFLYEKKNIKYSSDIFTIQLKDNNNILKVDFSEKVNKYLNQDYPNIHDLNNKDVNFAIMFEVKINGKYINSIFKNSKHFFIS